MPYVDYWGTVLPQDVVDVIKTSGSGLHEVQSLYERYQHHVWSQGRDPASNQSFGQALSRLGCRRKVVWEFQPEVSAESFPDHDWSSGEDTPAQTSSEHVR